MQSAGDDLISVDVADAGAARELAERLRGSGVWVEAVAGMASVVVQYDAAVESRTEAERRLQAVLDAPPLPRRTSANVIEIPVVYGGESGPDLERICAELGVSTAAFIEQHTGAYTIDLLGFIPGFAYVGGLDERLHVARLAAPRQFVPAGSIGIAGGCSGIYSLPGPGGWPLIGRTDMTLFDANRSEPFLLQAGATVVFKAVTA